MLFYDPVVLRLPDRLERGTLKDRHRRGAAPLNQSVRPPSLRRETHGCRGEYNECVPELSRFFGIIIRMFAEAGSPHHGAHFHAYYQEEVGIFSIDPIDPIAGSLPGRQRRLVEAWAELRQAELPADWQRLQQGRKPAPIEPLR